MATQVFADEELDRLRGFPEIGRDELFRFFTLTPADVAFVDPGRGRGPADRLAVALCTLPWLGFVPDKVSSAPLVAVARLADQLGVDPDELRTYGRRAKTRTEHLRLVAKYLGWRLPTTMERRGWNFVSAGHGDIPWEKTLRALTGIGHQCHISIEWEDDGLNPSTAPPALATIKKYD